MRVAVMSDIHGYSLALDTVMADLEASGPFDEVVVAGDLCEVGPAPDVVLDRLRATNFVVLKGNTDDDLVEGAMSGWEPSFWSKRIGPDGIAYLASLPFSHRVTPPGGHGPDDDLLVVHANPHDLHERLDPHATDAELLDVIGDTRAKAIAFGHIHIAYIRQVGDYLLVDVSAVGNPKDGDPRCKYGIIAWDEHNRRWTAELRRLPYPLDETIEQIHGSDLPDPDRTIRILRRAHY